MKASRLILLVLAAFTIAAVAQEYPQLEGWMKVNGAASAALSKMESKTGPQAVRAAERMGSTFEDMIDFWRQRNASDAAKLSEAGKADSVILASAANSGNAAEAESAFKRISATCQACHQAHRERLPEGGFRVK